MKKNYKDMTRDEKIKEDAGHARMLRQYKAAVNIDMAFYDSLPKWKRDQLKVAMR